MREDIEAGTWRENRDHHLMLGEVLCLRCAWFYERRLILSGVHSRVAGLQCSGRAHVGCVFVAHGVLELLVSRL